MITLLIGKKGSGKTKKLIELANEAVQNSNGNVLLTPTLTALRVWTHL